MANDKLRYLAQEVVAATKARAIPWEAVDGNEYAFELRLQAGSVIVRTWWDNDQDQWYGAKLLNSSGRLIEELEGYKGED